MVTSEVNVLNGPDFPFPIPKVSLGLFIYSKMRLHNSEDVMIREADTERTIKSDEFLRLSIQVCKGLEEFGIERGDVVTILGKSGIDVYATACGVLFAGGTVSPLDQNLDSSIFKQLLKTISPKFVFCDADTFENISDVLNNLEINAHIIIYSSELVSKMEAVLQKDESKSAQTFEKFVKSVVDPKKFEPVSPINSDESIAFLICSSGTTGVPKPVMISDKSLIYELCVWEVVVKFNKLLRCSLLTFSYFYWISAVLVYLSCICFNQQTTIVRIFEANHVFGVIQKYKPAWGVFAPALVKYLAHSKEIKKYDVSSLVLIITGGCSLQKEVVEAVKKYWGDHIYCRQSFGVTEMCGLVTASSVDDDCLSVGRLLPGFKMKVIDITSGCTLGSEEEGEIYFSSPTLMKGYLRNEENTNEVLVDGWFRSGDLGYYTEKGLIYITGRLKDIVICDGQKVNPVEVEKVILEIPGVFDVGVVGIKEADDNHFLMALVKKKEEADLTEVNILDGVKERLPTYKHLRAGVYFIEEIPKTPSGKMKRKEILDLGTSLYLNKN